MIKIIGISGSLRRNSHNTNLLRAARGLLAADAEITLASIAEIPLYNADYEAQRGIPPAVAALKDTIAGADALLLSTPEYNNSLPGVAKNAVDWLSRPPADIPRVFGGLPVGIMGASTGRFGTVLAQGAWLPVIRTLGARLWTGKMMASAAASVFDERGDLKDDATRKRLEAYLQGFAEYVGEARRRGTGRDVSP